MIIGFVYILFRILALFVGIWKQDFTLAVICFSAVSTVMVLIQLMWYLSIIRNHAASLK